jgi:signal transduction histidine kinase
VARGLPADAPLAAGCFDAIAHDLRTPLFILRRHLRGLERGVVGTPEKMAHSLAVCQAKADALERRISDLFAYARLEYLDQTLDRKPLELGALLLQAVEGEQLRAAAKGISLALNGTNEQCVLHGGSHLLVERSKICWTMPCGIRPREER